MQSKKEWTKHTGKFNEREYDIEKFAEVKSQLKQEWSNFRGNGGNKLYIWQTQQTVNLSMEKENGVFNVQLNCSLMSYEWSRLEKRLLNNI